MAIFVRSKGLNIEGQKHEKLLNTTIQNTQYCLTTHNSLYTKNTVQCTYKEHTTKYSLHKKNIYNTVHCTYKNIQHLHSTFHIQRKHNNVYCIVYKQRTYNTVHCTYKKHTTPTQCISHTNKTQQSIVYIRRSHNTVMCSYIEHIQHSTVYIQRTYKTVQCTYKKTQHSTVYTGHTKNTQRAQLNVHTKILRLKTIHFQS